MKYVYAALIMGLSTTSLHAQAAMETPEDVVELLEFCADATAAHEIVIPDNIAFGPAQLPGLLAESSDQVTFTTNIGRLNDNSFCDVLFQDLDFAQQAHDLFLQDKDGVIFEDSPGICRDDQHLLVVLSGPDSAMATTMKAQAHITVHNYPKYSGDPCAE